MKPTDRQIGLLPYELSRRPAVGIALPLVAGIFMSGRLQSSIPLIALFLISLLLMGLAYSPLLRGGNPLARQLARSFSAFFFCLFIGAFPAYTRLRSVDPYTQEQSIKALVRIESPASDRGSNYRYRARIYTVGSTKRDSLWQGADILLYQSKSVEDAQEWISGSLVKTTLQLVPVSQLLLQDERKGFAHYLLSHSCVATGYSGNAAELVGLDSSALSQKIFHVNRKMRATLATLGLPTQEEAALSAMLLGRNLSRGKESQRLYQQYAEAGAAHLLAVSGFHLGVVVGLVLLLTYPLRRISYGRVFSDLLLLVVAWAFALVTGAASSTLRAALMLSFVLLGRWMYRETDSMNMLAASALVLLLYNPFYVYDVGFCLSYVSVFSILLFFPLLQRLLPDLRNPLLRYLWSFFAIAVAVQPLSLPLCLYYFGHGAAISVLTNIPLGILASLLIPLALIYVLWNLTGIGGASLLTEPIRLLSSANSYLLERIELATLPSIDYRPQLWLLFLLWGLFIVAALYWRRFLALRQSVWQDGVHRYQS